MSDIYAAMADAVVKLRSQAVERVALEYRALHGETFLRLIDDTPKHSTQCSLTEWTLERVLIIAPGDLAIARLRIWYDADFSLVRLTCETSLPELAERLRPYRDDGDGKEKPPVPKDRRL